MRRGPALAALVGCAVVGCSAGAQAPAEAFRERWYAGQAELTRYELEQSRYGAIHDGDAVLIFVTEDFLPEEQVKFEGGRAASRPVSVLKLNFARTFTTGIYPYSALTSVFTPVTPGARSLKVSASVQEWCGHTYEQLNLRDGAWHGLSHSYFQQEADRDFRLDAAIPEDELWVRIRLDPAALPLGEVALIPGLQFARLAHRPSRVEPARASLTHEQELSVYRVQYAGFSRTLEIRFTTAFPHEIVAWEERGEAEQVTRARRTHTIMTDYWNKNAPADESWRPRLGLD